MSDAPPDRTLILPALILTFFLAAAGYLLGFSPLGDWCADRLRTRSTIWLLFVVFLIYSVSTSASILAPVNDYRFFASRFDRADRLIREARDSGLPSVEVPEVHNHFGLSDYGAGTTYWLDEAVDSYYGIHVIINKHKK